MSTAVLTLHTPRDPNPAGLVWEEPPARIQRSPYDEIAAALRTNPGRWAVIHTLPLTDKKAAWRRASAINQGKPAGLRPTLAGQFEAVARTTDTDVRVYARYIPAVTR